MLSGLFLFVSNTSPLNCVHPDGCLMPEVLIYMEDIESGDIEVQRVICKNQRCTVGNWMHLDCFEAFEDKVVRYLDMLAGRARSWNRTQRRMNIWTKKAYDQVQKVRMRMVGNFNWLVIQNYISNYIICAWHKFNL